jgi:hypothetical protein
MPRFLPAALLLLASLAPAARAARVEVETLGGETVTGELTAWTAETIALETNAGPRKIARAQLLALRPTTEAEAEPAAPSVWIDLVGGGRLEATGYTAANGVSRVQLLGGAKLEIPTRSIEAARFKAEDEQLAAQWRQIRGLNIAGDLFVIRKNDAIDHLEGVLGEITADKVNFEFDGDTIPVSRDKVEGVIYYAAARPELPEAICVVEGPGGTRLRAREIKLDGEQVELTSVTGLKLALPLKRLRGLDFSLGKIRYLSAIQPRTSEWTPYFDLFAQLPSGREFFRPRMDRALEGGPLRLDGKSYRRGLALRSGVALTYRLPEGFARFTAIAGIDDRMGESGSVQLTIRGDGRELFSAALRGGEPPKTLDLDVAGVRSLTIEVGYGDDADIADHLDLCDARISK